MAPWCDSLTLQPEQSGGVGSNPGMAPPLERHDKGSRTRLGLLLSAIPALGAEKRNFTFTFTRLDELRDGESLRHGGSSLGAWGGPHGRKMGVWGRSPRKYFVATPFRRSENVGNAFLLLDHLHYHLCFIPTEIQVAFLS